MSRSYGRHILKWSFGALLGGLAILGVAFIVLPDLLDWMSPPPARGPALETRRSVPSERSSIAPTQSQVAGGPKSPALPPSTKPESPSATAAAKLPAQPEPGSGEPRIRQALTPVLSEGGYWVQVGAFKNPAHAERLAAKLSADNYPVRRATLSRPLEGNHAVRVSGASKPEVDGKLLGSSYQTEVGADGVVIRPLRSLKEAVSLSRELSSEGFTVKIRRGRITLHVVRAGAYRSRKRAEEVRAALQTKGFPRGLILRDERC